MCRIILAGAGLAVLLFTAGAASAQSYTRVHVTADERSGPSRQIGRSVGQMRETACTFTPLFGDGSFQLDGPDIAVRPAISDGEGGLFAVSGPGRRVPVGGP